MGAVEVYSFVVGGDFERWVVAVCCAAVTGMLRGERWEGDGDLRSGRHGAWINKSGE